MLRKRKNPTPGFRMPPPFQPITGERAALAPQGVHPYVAMMQVAKEDTHTDYVVCRGFDVRISKFIEYESANTNKPGIPVAKPYGKRGAGLYRIGQVFGAVLPYQPLNPSPTAVGWRVGQNPGVAATSTGHPADLDEDIETLLTDGGDKINYMLLDSEIGLIPGKVTESGGIAAGGSGDCAFYEDGTGAAVSRTETVHLSWAEGTQTAAENAECYVSWFPGDQKWRIVILDCEAT